MSSRDNSRNPMLITVGADVAAGGFILVQSILFWCPEAILSGATGAGYWKDSVIKGAPKATGATWTKGQILYWDNSAKKFTPTSTSNTLRAFAAADAASGDATGDIEFCQVAA